MIKKIISIKNVGRFKNSAAQGNPQLAKHVLILGANGYGKTTLCSIFRSLQTGDCAHIIGRKTLGVIDDPSVELLLDPGTARFEGVDWSKTLPNLAIFDGTFVAENVHSGEIVEINHKRNLYRIIIGQEGVHLVEEEARLATESRAKTSEISALAKAIQPHIPADMTIAQFLVPPTDPDDPEIDTKIIEQARSLEAVRQASQIQARNALSEVTLPILPCGLTELLGRTIENIAVDSERQLADHLAVHGMEVTGQAWLADGLAHASGDACPFCGQDIQSVPIIVAYRAIFSGSYKSLKADVTDLHKKINQLFGDGAIGKLETLAEQNRGGVEFWGRFCAFDTVPLSMPTEISDAIQALGQSALALLIRKANSPLEPVALDDTFNTALVAYDRVQDLVKKANIAIRAMNTLITTKKTETGTENVKLAESQLARLKAIKDRHETAIAKDCTDYNRLADEKEAIEKSKTDIRTRLGIHTNKVVKLYEKRINEYLNNSNAGFSLTKTKHSYPGGVATSSYQLVINGTPIDVGNGRTPISQPSFKNTLSSGDRTTLALAFFFAHLERDADRAQKIVVLDDPFNSQDAFRRRQTVHEIQKAGNYCDQIVVLSHDATFLKQVWDKVPATERTAINIVDHHAQGSKIMPVNLEEVCQGRTATEIDDLQTFLTSGAGKLLDLIRKMRVVLETYCWTTYPSSFQSGKDLLGEIVRKIRKGNDDHPAKPLYDELDQINDYTSQYHHGENTASGIPEKLDQSELSWYVRLTLKVVNASQA